jgi:hypothetical protein
MLGKSAMKKHAQEDAKHRRRAKGLFSPKSLSQWDRLNKKDSMSRMPKAYLAESAAHLNPAFSAY